MRSPFHSPIFSIIGAEILFNRKRVAPYFLLILFCANAVLWWPGASVYYGWAPNSDFYIVRLYGGFTFMTTPFFVAMLMGDAVTRDFRFEFAPLLLSKPMHRAEYLLGKFFGNFIVLTACCSIFALTIFLLQAVRLDKMIVLPFRIAPYFNHFVMLVVISHLVLAAFCFMVGTLTRSAKLVYGFVTALYVVYIPTKIVIQHYSLRFGKLFDLFPFDWVNAPGRNRPAELVNQLVITYDGELIANRCIMLAVAAICLTIAYRRFTAIDKGNPAKQQTSALGLLGLTEKSDRLYHEEWPAGSYQIESAFERRLESVVKQKQIPLPQVTLSHTGWRAWLSKLFAAITVEFRLLGGERSLVIMIPLAVLMCLAQIPPFIADLGASPFLISASYAAHSAEALLLLLFGVAIFFTGESVSRDRELDVEATLWCAPAPDAVFLLSKFTAVFCLSLCFIALGALTALATQSYRNFASLKLFPYFTIYSVILLPTVAFMTGASLLLSVLLREKYIAYIVGVTLGGGLFYLFGQGYTGWLYNPSLHQLWSYAELSESGKLFARILLHRVYWLAITTACLALAHRFFPRKATNLFFEKGRFSEKAWAMSIAIVSALVAIVTGLMVVIGDWS